MFILDHFTSNYSMKPHFDNHNVSYVLDQKPIGSTVSKSLISAKSKTSSESIAFGKINSSGYLSEDMHKQVNSYLNNFDFPETDKFIAMGPICSYLFAGETLKYSSGRIYDWKNPNTGKKSKVYIMHHPDSIFTSDHISSKFKNQLPKAINFLSDNIVHTKNCTTSVIKETDVNQLDNLISADIETEKNSIIDCISLTNSNQENLSHWKSTIVEYPSNQLNEHLYGKNIIFQNSSYDLSFMQRYMKFDISKIDYEDTMILSRLIDPFELSSLDDLARKYTPHWSSWKSMNK